MVAASDQWYVIFVPKEQSSVIIAAVLADHLRLTERKSIHILISRIPILNMGKVESENGYLQEEGALHFPTNSSVMGWPSLDTRCPLKPPCHFILLSWTGERKQNERLVGWDKNRESSLTSYHHGQTASPWGNEFNLVPIKSERETEK